jgi:prevent-host-death family protein
LAIQEALTRFRDLADSALDEGPQRVTRHGKQAVVVVSEEEWNRRAGPRKSFGDLLVTCALRAEDQPPRRAARVVRKEPPQCRQSARC